MAPPRKRDDNWVDGLRGVASFIVVTGHLCTAFVPHLHQPSAGENGSSSLFQLPFFRLCVSGRAAVAIFFIITGFVNSLNPVKNSRSNNTHVGLKNLARSSFTRSGRLIIPTSIATCIGWFLCQIGMFRMAGKVDAGWIKNGGREPDGDLGSALAALFRALTLFWHSGPGEYDNTHWTLVYFLKGSFRVYLVLLAMMLVKSTSYRIVSVVLYLYCWIAGDYLVGINIYAGLLLAQLQIDIGSRATSLLPKPVPSLLILMGLFMCSYPQDNPEWAFWSKSMRDMMVSITPLYTETGRYWVSIGTTTLMVGIFFSRNARRVLTLPLFNFLGRVSFPVYLLHNTLMRTVLVWMVYGPASASGQPTVNEKGEAIDLKRVSGLAFVFILPVFYALLYAVGYGWTSFVDPLCAKAVNYLRDVMFMDEEKAAEKVTAAAAAAAAAPIPLTTIA
ncbi:hypothetical protein AJ80_03075 [Polytolypa hystricis UAMH7299]|uniref:Acyltransferase 3 domain-containing protein n=1 Tax=Polytolypa hystricis (strain UAMH7299) TaxID=1447883 RepID=A0A2B7YLA3_POLH7|nr:hypothetical protein AJ80_03075 [Polytolypa hystricis UAMH7299]